jgi:transposase
MKRKKRQKQRSARGRKRLLALERRRRRAARLFKAKEKQAEVARVLGVSRQSVSRWYRQWRRGGVKRLQAADRAGRRPRLDSAQLEKVARELLKGPEANGFPTNLWTLKRVATVIERITGVHYHPGHVWKILGQMGWSLQKPAKRAKERNEEAVREWMQRRWPEIKKKPGESAVGSSSRTRAASPKSRRCGERGRPKEKRQS